MDAYLPSTGGVVDGDVRVNGKVICDDVENLTGTNYMASTAQMKTFVLPAGSSQFTIASNTRHFLFFAAATVHGIAEAQSISSGATYYYPLTTINNLTTTTGTNLLTLNNATNGEVVMLVITVRGAMLTSA